MTNKTEEIVSIIACIIMCLIMTGVYIWACVEVWGK